MYLCCPLSFHICRFVARANAFVEWKKCLITSYKSLTTLVLQWRFQTSHKSSGKDLTMQNCKLYLIVPKNDPSAALCTCLVGGKNLIYWLYECIFAFHHSGLKDGPFLLDFFLRP